MYEAPKLERFGSFRELTQFTLLQAGGDGFGSMCGNSSVGPAEGEGGRS